MAVMAGSYAGFSSTSSVSQASRSSQAPYVPIFPIPYTMSDPNFGMTGSYASNGNVNGTIITCQLCRKIGHGAKTCRILSSFGKGGYHGGHGNGNTITCQLCKQIGHGAKTCSTLSTFRQGIGFPNHQQRNLLGDASAMIATGKSVEKVEKVSSLQSQSHLNITVPTCFPLTQSSCQSLVPALVLPYSTTARLPPSVILSSNPKTSSYAKLAKRQYDQVHDKVLNLTSEKDAIQLVNQELNAKVMELQKIQESVMVQLSAECRIARERIEKLESGVEALVSKEMKTEKLVSELELKIDFLSESSRSSEHKIQYLLLKISALETENKDNAEKLQAEIWKKAEQIVGLLKEGETHVHHIDLMDKQVNQLHVTLEEKEQLIQQYKEQEKNLEEQIS